MKIGTYYYPEQWPRSQWERDFDAIAAMGLQIVHMAEFAWFSLEPSPGKFQFDWLDECLNMAQKRKLDVILCTPTAAPPVWLTHQHPEVLPVDRCGQPGRFGGRRHYSPNAPALHEATRRIVTAMADRWGNHPSVIGWQIDNEYSGNFDQSPTTHAGFRAWLQKKYGSIEKLNEAWGCQFWNTYYTDWDQIMMPPVRDNEYANPHHRLDASRYWSGCFAQFNKLQADILRPRIGQRFLTTNFMPFHMDADPGDLAPDLSLMSWDSYPVTGWEKNPTDETFRISNPASICLMHEQMASYHGRWALLEVQPGQTNWSGYPVLLYPGTVRLYLWTAWAHGAEFITTYRFRQPRFGTELFHHGLMMPDGVTDSPGGRQFEQVITELKRLKPVPPVTQENDPRHTIGIVLDFEQLWYYATLPQAKRWNQPALLAMWYAAAMRLGLRVKVLRPGQPWPGDLAMIIAPGVQMLDGNLLSQMKQYVDGGGHLVLTCRTGLMDRNGQLWEGPIAQPIVPLIGGTIDAYDALPEGVFGKVELEDKEYPWGVWGDLLFAEEGTRVLAKYADQFYAGAAAVIQKSHGKGTVTYCGVYGEQEFTDALLESLYRAMIQPAPAKPARARKGLRAAAEAPPPFSVLPPRVELLRRGPYWVLLNYQDKPVEAPAPPGAKFLVGSATVEGAGVAVWEAP